jgi:hypothetical protein
LDSGDYGRIMGGEYPLRDDDTHVRFGDDVGAAARNYKDNFDQSNDPLIRGIRDGLGGIVDGVGQAATTAVDSLGRKISEWRQNAKSDEPPTA